MTYLTCNSSSIVPNFTGDGMKIWDCTPFSFLLAILLGGHPYRSSFKSPARSLYLWSDRKSPQFSDSTCFLSKTLPRVIENSSVPRRRFLDLISSSFRPPCDHFRVNLDFCDFSPFLLSPRIHYSPFLPIHLWCCVFYIMLSDYVDLSLSPVLDPSFNDEDVSNRLSPLPPFPLIAGRSECGLLISMTLYLIGGLFARIPFPSIPALHR